MIGLGAIAASQCTSMREEGSYHQSNRVSTHGMRNSPPLVVNYSVGSTRVSHGSGCCAGDCGVNIPEEFETRVAQTPFIAG